VNTNPISHAAIIYLDPNFALFSSSSLPGDKEKISYGLDVYSKNNRLHGDYRIRVFSFLRGYAAQSLFRRKYDGSSRP
jgi:hypothetical protein